MLHIVNENVSPLSLILERHPAHIQDIAQRLREIIKETLPAAEEKIYIGWHAIGYHQEGSGYFCAIFPTDDLVRVGFELGALFNDPQRLLQPGTSKGKQVRYLPYSTVFDLKPEILQDFLRQAVEAKKRS